MLSKEVELHMRSTRALELERRRLNDVTVNANVGLVLLDYEARVQYANPLIEDWFGPSSEIVGEFCWQLFGLDDPATQCAGIEAVRTKKTVRGNSFTKVSGGRELYFYVVATPIIGDDGNVKQVTEVVVDITAHKLAEDAIRDARDELQKAHDELEERVIERTQMLEQATRTMRDSEARFRAISESAQDAIIVVEPDSTIIFWNTSAERMFGFTHNETIGRKVESLIIPERHRQRHEQAFASFMKTGRLKGTGSTIELHALCKDGSEMPIELSLSGLDVENEDWRAVAVIRDITERKRAEEAARLARFTVDAASDALFWISEDARFIDVNAAASSLLGYTREELLEMKVTDVDPHLSGDKWPQYFADLRESGFVTRERLHRAKDGRLIPVEVVGNFVKDGEVEFSCAFVRDITERKEHAEMLAARFEETRKTLAGFIDAMTTTVEARDPYTSGHQHRVATISAAIARELGLLEEEVQYIDMAARVHDLGKISIPSEVLSKPGKLSPVEFKMIHTHSESGYDILRNITFPYPIEQVAYQHHERLDGSGYPRGLRGDDIIMAARIVAVADVLEAMCSHRPYRPALGIDEALAEITSKSGTGFDSDVVNACLKLVNSGELEL